jgi:hypothetical protein
LLQLQLPPLRIDRVINPASDTAAILSPTQMPSAIWSFVLNETTSPLLANIGFLHSPSCLVAMPSTPPCFKSLEAAPLAVL